jgi:hypothetical protein
MVDGFESILIFHLVFIIKFYTSKEDELIRSAK